ncbi:MAG: hypothetical protein B7Z39_00495 [Novosphingobium sp. 12-64-8]|nr:MAG: hypothetical protein B7Z39_00495 [Novosphingobium sp. 12-64-8]
MVEERVVEVERPAANHTTIVTDRPSSGGAGWLIAIVLIVAVVAGIYFFANMSDSRTAKDNAIAGAAKDVGEAASKVGNAADEAASNVTKN